MTFRLATLSVAATILLDSCSSTPKIEGVPSKLPEIALNGGSTATPLHHMAGYEYPFDSAGNYVTDWAAEGERRSGRSARATSDDEEKWSRSHGGSSGSSKTKKTTGTKPKTVASSSKKPSDDEPPAKKTGTTSKTTSTGSTTKYVVKKGDTVERIARHFGIKVSALMAANGMKSDLIRDGQSLKIPK